MNRGQFFVDHDGNIIGYVFDIWHDATLCNDPIFMDQADALADALLEYDDDILVRCTWSDMGAWHIDVLVAKI